MRIPSIFELGFAHDFDWVAPPEPVNRMRVLIEALRSREFDHPDSVSTEYALAELKWAAQVLRHGQDALRDGGTDNRKTVKRELEGLAKALEGLALAAAEVHDRIMPQYTAVSRTGRWMLGEVSTKAGEERGSDPLEFTAGQNDGRDLVKLSAWAETAHGVAAHAAAKFANAGGRTRGSADTEFLLYVMKIWCALAGQKEAPPIKPFLDFASAAYRIAGQEAPKKLEVRALMARAEFPDRSPRWRVASMAEQEQLVRATEVAELALSASPPQVFRGVRPRGKN